MDLHMVSPDFVLPVSANDNADRLVPATAAHSLSAKNFFSNVLPFSNSLDFYFYNQVLPL